MDKWCRMQHREKNRSCERRFIHIEDIIKISNIHLIGIPEEYNSGKG